MAAARILLVEDDTGIRDSVAECLELEGYQVSAVANGSDALEWLAREAPPDVMLVDLVMPVMSGGELLARVRADPRLASVPAVLMTAAIPGVGSSPPAADATLAKPFELDALLDVVERLSGPRA
ncbi:MAG TPA: response regulator [Anaeromyxobacter sp.]|nr:response regulator [Anaeromyxobacter sp.]